MRPFSRVRTGRNQGAAGLSLESCPKCGNPTIYLEQRDNSLRCKNMVCGYRSGGQRPGRPRRYTTITD